MLESSEQSLVESSDASLQMPWSLEVEKTLEKHSDKFRTIYCYERFACSEYIWLNFIFVSVVFIVVFAVFGLRLFDPSISISYRWMAQAAFILILLWTYNQLKRLYGLKVEKGYFFLTDTGILIIAPGYKGKDMWVYYADIDDIQIVSYPNFKRSKEQAVRIHLKGGKTEEYSSTVMDSPYIFQAFYNRLIMLYNESKEAKSMMDAG